MFYKEISTSYDNIIPLGDNCATSIILKELGLRKKAYPFDWCSHIGPNPTYSIIEYNIILLLELLDCGDLEKITNKFLGECIDENNKINGDIIFPHELGTKDEIKNKYKRRFKRLYDDITNLKNNNLFIIITRCYLINCDLLIKLYNKLLLFNPTNQFIFVSGIIQNLNMQCLTNLSFKHIFYDESNGWNPDSTIFRPLVKEYLNIEINKNESTVDYELDEFVADHLLYLEQKKEAKEKKYYVEPVEQFKDFSSQKRTTF